MSLNPLQVWVPAMKIDSSQLSLQSQHLAASRTEERETLRAWIGDRRPDFEGRERPALPAAVIEISPDARALQAPPDTAGPADAQAIKDAADEAVENDPFLSLIRSMVEMLTGHRVKVFSAKDLASKAEAVAVPSSHAAQAALEAPPRRERAGFGIEYDYHAVREEAELTTFSAQGVVRTADGKEIAFRLDLAMSRSYREETNVSLRAGDAVRKDPLVINFDGTAAQLSSQTFRFDLDADGQAEDVPLLSGNRAYLALDLNANGKIDSGVELLGPSTGQGFAELARHDYDGNGWIDESDAVFDRLLVWTPSAEGDGKLASLKASGVGALYLGEVASPFELRGEGNADLGAVRSTGLYLTESGRAGTLQEIDLTV